MFIEVTAHKSYCRKNKYKFHSPLLFWGNVSVGCLRLRLSKYSDATMENPEYSLTFCVFSVFLYNLGSLSYKMKSSKGQRVSHIHTQASVEGACLSTCPFPLGCPKCPFLIYFYLKSQFC